MAASSLLRLPNLGIGGGLFFAVLLIGPAFAAPAKPNAHRQPIHAASDLNPQPLPPVKRPDFFKSQAISPVVQPHLNVLNPQPLPPAPAKPVVSPATH